MIFFNQLHSFGENIALIDCQTSQRLSYIELNKQSNVVAKSIGSEKELVFIEAKNNIASVIAYIAALKANKVIYLLDALQDSKSQLLVELYQPNIVINGDGLIKRNSEGKQKLHDDLTLLLSTSGSTGTPKFVKLCQKNLHSNAKSIAEYLKLTEFDVALSHLKLHYSYGLSVLHSHLSVGATTAFTTHGVLDDGFWLDVKKYSATSFAGVPYTFEALAQNKFDFKPYTSLRYITQAGGKLEDALVEDFANKTKKIGIDFYVMYGQTEAAPRISYLPPALACEFPGSIGHAIPGGTLSLVDESGVEIVEENTPGELAYQGDNVMMGYAKNPSDLLVDDTPDVLLTGDIAYKTSRGLFYIVGRTKRFVKLFGLRVNLDDVQSFVKKKYPKSAVAGNDKHIVIAVENNNNLDSSYLLSELSNKYALPREKFKVVVFGTLPLLINGKYDYKSIMIDKPIEIRFISQIVNKVIDILGFNTQEWDSIHDLFCSSLQLNEIADSESFIDLDTDSLIFVQLSIELESCLGDKLPGNWQECTIASLDALYQNGKFA
jgi:acyl-CoA synthetase (AMP-forming)/AMP-acid ligase II/acyl carrier protein